jgi:flagellin-like protein
MIKPHKFFRNLHRLWRRRKAVSPVIATVLLIGIAVIGGFIVLAMITTVYSQQEPINVRFIGASNFRSTELVTVGYDSTVDYFEITLQNMGQEAIFFYKTDFQVINVTGSPIIPEELLSSWWIDDSRREIIINGGEIITFPVKTVIDSHELRPDEDSARINIVFIRRLETPDEAGFEDFVAETFLIRDTYGPVEFKQGASGFNNTHWNLTFSTTNWGTESINLGVQIIFYNETAFNAVNQTLVTEIMGHGDGSNSKDILFQFQKTGNFRTGTTYLFFVKVYDTWTNSLFGSYTIDVIE